METAGWDGGGVRKQTCFLWSQSLVRRLSKYRTHPHLSTAPTEDPSVAPGHSRPHPKEESSSPCPQFGTPGTTSISRKTRNSTKHPRCCQGCCGGHQLVDITCLWRSPICGRHLLALPAHMGHGVEGGFWVRPWPHIQVALNTSAVPYSPLSNSGHSPVKERPGPGPGSSQPPWRHHKQ